MVRPKLSAGTVLEEIARVVSSTEELPDRARTVLRSLRRLVPLAAGALAVVDTDRREFVPLASVGYGPKLEDHLRTPGFYDQVKLVGLTSNRPALCLRDIPDSPARQRCWAEFLEPVGLQDGVGASLFTTEGRHLGLMTLHTRNPQVADEEVRELVDRIAPSIAEAIDPVRFIAVVGRMVTDASAGVALTLAGDCLPLPGLATDHLLRPGSDTLATAAALADKQPFATFLAPSRDGYTKVTVLVCPNRSIASLQAMVLLSPPPDLRGLTRRELEIIGLLTEGWPNSLIATTLSIAYRTVDAHVAHILAKLGAPTRTLAAISALQLGLYVPRPLNGVPL